MSHGSRPLLSTVLYTSPYVYFMFCYLVLFDDVLLLTHISCPDSCYFPFISVLFPHAQITQGYKKLPSGRDHTLSSFISHQAPLHPAFILHCRGATWGGFKTLIFHFICQNFPPFFRRRMYLSSHSSLGFWIRPKMKSIWLLTIRGCKRKGNWLMIPGESLDAKMIGFCLVVRAQREEDKVGLELMCRFRSWAFSLFPNSIQAALSPRQRAEYAFTSR